MLGARAEGDVTAHRRGAGNDAGARPPPRPAGCGSQARRPHLHSGPAINMSDEYCLLLAPRRRAWGPAAECEVISARALSRRPTSIRHRNCE